MPNQPATETTATETTTKAGNVIATATTTVKPGWKTTEFWLTSLAILIGVLWASGAISPEGTSSMAKAVVLVAAILGKMGYTVSRGLAKAGK